MINNIENKKNTYQKLKEENLKLKNQIRVLVNNPESYEASLIKLESKLKYDLEDEIFYGSPTNLHIEENKIIENEK